ncbi:anaerobic carbon-monoxide dehydrogenase catalytic subunit [Pseudodesulfovibrio piezophilus]|uniref:Carbon monoxide dehydrogenase n=1 Tax=Pseudodesulfovibrio piezophilus (strain DSM 21447 / JCM 15486 / C1TLV30) TaxID=1322246 RepID=M1WU55_PSEP2|nr:anaerobic carbon-monoxide dehydrogenase catalytic subunit [Pseudodesulfovibrio piezophilus]CCH50252.1 Carbon monoxide dehydrogenase 1 [Pseudodesulfovibrio piezophilus C1TLV30]
MSHSNSIDKSMAILAPIAEQNGIDTPWDRYEKMLPQCGFGELGVCCRICWKGPCRIDPFGNGPDRGICGATAEVIVARNLIRMQAAGAAAHSEHGRHIALAMKHLGEKGLDAYAIKDEAKLKGVAERLGIEAEGKTTLELAVEVADISLNDFMNQDHHKECTWLSKSLPPVTIERLRKAGVLPHNIDAAVANVMARTHVGCDSDHVNLLLAGIRAAMADYTGMVLATELSDSMFGTPKPVITKANLGVLKEDAVNIALHGHNPLLSEVICDMAMLLNDEAIAAGASAGINVVGICCTGNEVMMRRGVPLATNYLSQDMAILTGAIDGMVVDVQCIMPSIATFGSCFHTEVITTMPDNKITGARHVEFSEKDALDRAREIVRICIDAYRKRDPHRVNIPQQKETAIVGFSTEAIVEALSLVNAEDPLKPLIDAIVSGDIKGVALFAGCNNVKIKQDHAYMTVVKELLARNVLVLATGCGAGAFAKHGMMTQEATEEFAGESLKGVLTAVGTAAGLEGPLPPVMHMGSCVDNSRAVMLASALAKALDKDLSELPVVASAPELMSEKAVAIGSWAVALGFPTHVGIMPQITGAPGVVEVLTKTAKDIFGGYFIPETDPVKAAETLYDAILERRKGLGLSV